MKTLKNINIIVFVLPVVFFASCSSSSQIEKQIVGKYASKSENNYDDFKDTLEVKATYDGKFDVQIIANWSAAKKDDPQRPNKNKKAGVWNNYGIGKVEVATLQSSDTTLRITEPITGKVRIIKADLNKKTITETSADGVKFQYLKIPD